MKHRYMAFTFAAAISGIVWMPALVGDDDVRQGLNLTVSPVALTFNAIANGAAPPAQALTVSLPYRTSFVASASVSGGGNWLSISPSGAVSATRNVTASVNQAGLAAGTYHGTVSLAVSSRNTLNVAVTLVVSTSGGGSGSSLAASPSALTFHATLNAAAPAAQNLAVSAPATTSFTAGASTQSGGNWLAISPSGSLTTPRTISVSVNPSGLAAATYSGTISLAANSVTRSVAVTLVVNAASSGGSATGYKLIGWNDLGMHCFDGADYSIFGVLPPYNTIHTHLIDSAGKLVVSPTGYTVTYQAVNDPLTNTLNTTSRLKTNFWQFAAALGFGALAPDVGWKGYAMPGTGNAAQAMNFSTADNTWLAEGIPMTPFADAAAAPYPKNYFPMMRLVAKNSSGTVIASTDIVLPTSDEMSCSVCHASTSSSSAAQPAGGWVNNSDVAKDVKLNILRKHDDRFKNVASFLSAVGPLGYSSSGLEATANTIKPVFCDNCHASNALAKPGVAGIPALTTSMHSLHSTVVNPATNQPMESSATRDSCYLCHPGPNTQCLRGAMGTLKNAGGGGNAIECQSCHGPMSSVAVATRKGWLDEPNCQSCHTGTATSNAGQIAYTSVFSSGATVRTVTDTTFATNPNTPAAGISLYRYSSGHGGLQCEACHGSTHAEFPTTVPNDNVQSTNLQGHVGALAECTACHSSVPSTTTGGPHGLHPIGTTWVSRHQDVAEGGGAAACQACHGTDYRGTILSKTQADRTLAGHTFPRGTIIGCYSCHNGPNGGG
jgi:Viral BACON domain